MNEEELQKQAEGLLGNWVWLFVSGVALLLFKSTIELKDSVNINQMIFYLLFLHPLL